MRLYEIRNLKTMQDISIKRKTVPALKRALDVLDLLASHNGAFRFSEIQEQLKIPKASLFRILYQLLNRGYIQKDSETGRYKLGAKLVLLGTAFLDKLDVRDEARPIVKKLAQETGETVELAILNRGKILYIDKYESSESIRLVAEIGSQYPTLHASAIGKVFLAYMDKDEFNSFLKNVGLVKITERTIVDADTLIKECEEIKRKGFAYDNQECRIGVSRIASPIFNHLNKVIAAVGIAGPTFRIAPEKKEDMGQIVKKAGMDISRKMGYINGDRSSRLATNLHE